MRSVIDVTILSGASVSSVADLGLDGSFAGFISPAEWTAAGVQLEGSMDGTNFFPMHFEDGNLIGVATVTANKLFTVLPMKAVAARYVRLRSGTSASPVNQGANRGLKIISRKFC